MAKETKEERIRRIIDKTKEGLGMTGQASTAHQSTVDLGVYLDPDYYEVSAESGWGFFEDAPRHLDPMTRQVIGSLILAHRDRGGCYYHARKALEQGATMEQLMEAFAVASIPGGRPTARAGLEALKRIANDTDFMTTKRSKADIPDMEQTEAGDRTQETHEERVRRIIRKIERHGGVVDDALAFGVNLDPHYFEAYSKLAWCFFTDQPRYWDPIHRELFILVIMAFRQMREEVYLHCKKALKLGATMEQLLEAFEAGVIPGGSSILSEGLYALKRINDEQTGAGKQDEAQRRCKPDSLLGYAQKI